MICAMKQGATWLFRVYRGLTNTSYEVGRGGKLLVINEDIDITDITPRNGALITCNW